MTGFRKNIGMACAMVLVAGTMAHAKDAVGASSSTGGAAPFTPSASFDAGRLARVGFCEDAAIAWDNGDWDGVSGQPSHEGGAVTDGTKAADDFFLSPCSIWDLREISGCMLTNSKFANGRARLELYADCNGCPGELLYTFTEFTKTELADVGDGFYLVQYVFNIANQTDEDEYLGIALRGGNYWVSLVGLTDGSPNHSDISYFGTANHGVIRQAVAKKIDGVAGYGTASEYSYSGQSWIGLNEGCACVGCTDLCFEVIAHPCEIYVDNGGSDRYSVPAGSRSEYAPNDSGRNQRTADNIGTNPCEGITVCYFEACVYTNCPTPKAVLEVYENDCDEPAYSLGSSPFKGPFDATKRVLLGSNVVTIDGRAMKEYRFEWHDLAIDLAANANYWFAVSVKDNFGFNDRAYWCYNWTCEDDCEIHISPAQHIGPAGGAGAPAPKWTELSDDMSFLVAIEHEDAGDTVLSGNTCAADFNRVNGVTVQDIFDFLTAWLAGCPQ